PLEVLHRAAGVFRMAGYVLGQRFLLRLGLVVPLADGGMQVLASLRTADPLAGNPVGFGNPGGKLVRAFVLCHFESPYIVSQLPPSSRGGKRGRDVSA